MTMAITQAPDDASNTSLTHVVSAYGKRLFRFIRGRVRNDADAEDVVQDVWYQFSRVMDAEPIEQISAWLFRVARNRLTDLYRRKKEDSLEDYVYEDEDGELFFKELLLSSPETPDTELLKSTVWEVLIKALDELPEAQRNVFVWNELEDETLQSIADRTGENIKTLISRKRYAVQHLRRRLEHLYEDLLNR